MKTINQNISGAINASLPNFLSGRFQLYRLIFTVLFLLTTTLYSDAAQRTWTGGTSTDWNTASNWSGSTVPTSTDTVTIQTGTFNCLLAANTTIKQFTLTSDTLDLNGYTLTVTNNATTTAGLITNGTLTINGSGVVTFNGGTISVTVNATAASIKFSGGTFNNVVTAVKKGSTNSTGNGGCTFASDVTLIDSSTSNWTFANTTADTWSGKVVVKETSSGTIYFAHNNAAANSFSKSVTLTNTSTGNINCDYYGNSTFHDSIIINGTSSGDIRFGIGGGKTTLDTSIIIIGTSGFSSSGILHLGGILQSDATKSTSLTTTGTTKLEFAGGSVWYGTVTASAPYMKCDGGRFLGVTNLTYTANNTSASDGGTYFGGITTLSRNATSTGTFSLGTTYTDTFVTTTTIQNLNAGTVSIANAKFNGKVVFKNQASSGSERFFIAEGGTCTFKDSVTFDNTTSGMRIGSGGSALFDTSAQINILSTFTGTFKVNNVIQNGTTAINFPFQSNTDILYLNSGNIFSGPVTINAQRIQLNGSTFNNTFYLKRTGSGSDASEGNNVFNGTTTIIDSNSTTHTFTLANTYADDFNGNVTFKQYGTNCKLYPAYTKSSTFAGNLTVDGSAVITFGYNGGKVIIDGGSQTITKTGSYNPAIKKLVLQNTGATCILGLPLTVSDSIIFTSGYLATDATNLLTVPDNCIVTGASDYSIVLGPIKKVGNDAFTFPFGGPWTEPPPIYAVPSFVYHPLTISAPSSPTDAFTAEYFHADPAKGTNADSTIENESTCEYWRLDRTNGSSNVTVKLGWGWNSCNVYGMDSMHVAVWDTATVKWKDEGNGGTTGTLETGTVVSSSAISTFGIMTLADKFCTTLKPVTTATDVSCLGSSNGTARISASGATEPYTYRWSPRTGGSVSLWDLSAGTYYITVTDSRSCVITDSAIVSNPDSIHLSISSTPSDCHDSVGTAKITATGGAGGYFYFWAPGGLTGDSIGGLSAGIYEVIVSDAKGCSVDTSIAISDSDGPDIEVDSLVNVGCNGFNTGSARIIYDGGGPIEHDPLWPCGVQSGERLRAGNYPVMVEDDDGCITLLNVTISEPSAIALNLITTQSECGDSTGTATVVASGGTGSYTYSWSSGGNSDTELNLRSGYDDTLTVTDENGCTASIIALITDSNSLTLSVSKADVICWGDSTGVASISVTGGTSPFNYSWSNGYSDTAAFTNLIRGEYKVIVTDSNGCIQAIEFEIASPEPLQTQITQINPSTDSTSDGSITIASKGGSPIYSYYWSPPGTFTGSTVNGLLVGEYILTLEDDNGCQATNTVKLIPTQLVTPITCNNGGCTTASNPCGGNFPCILDITAGYFGAVGDGLTDDQCAFEMAVNYITANSGSGPITLEIPSGTYIVGRQDYLTDGFLYSGKSVICLEGVSNVTIKGIPDVLTGELPTIKFRDCMYYGSFDPVTGDRFLNAGFPGSTCSTCSAGGNFCFYRFGAFPGNCINIHRSNNVLISGLILDGNVDNANIGGYFSDPSGIALSYSGISISNSSLVSVENVRAHHFGFDGISIDDLRSSPQNMHLTLKNSSFNNNARTGLAWVGGTGVYALNCEFDSTSVGSLSHPTFAGMDIEWEGGQDCADGHFTDCRFMFNEKYGIIVSFPFFRTI